MKRKREEDNNLLRRLLQRETRAAPPAAEVSSFRQFYENVPPNMALTGIVPPSGTCIARFTPCGRYLVAFDAVRNEVVLYAYKGLFAAQKGPEAEQQPTWHRSGHSVKFEDAFAPHVRCTVAAGPEEQLFAFCLVVHSDYLILATSTPDSRPFDPEGHWMGVSEAVTFYLVRIADGEIADKVTLRVEGLDLSHHSAATLYGDILAVLAPAQQTVFVLQILPEGKLVMKCTLGRWCLEDDTKVARAQEDAEENAVDEALGAAAYEEILLRDSAVPPPPGAVLRVQRVPPSVPLPPPMPDFTYNDHLNNAADPPPPLEGVKQRLLAHLYLSAREESEEAAAAAEAAENDAPLPAPVRLSSYGLCGGRQALRTFYYFFKFYCDLEMHRVQLLDEDRLLISWLPPIYSTGEGSTYRTAFMRGLQTVYNMSTTQVERMFEGGTAEFNDWCIANPAAVATGCPESDWERYLMPGPWAQRARKQENSGTAGSSSYSRDSNNPAGCQMRQTSPYLDPELFQFDERAVTRDSLPRPVPHRASKFVARAWPERLCFRIEAEDITGGPIASALLGGDRVGRRAFDHGPIETLYLFHPSQPFVIGVVESSDTGMAEELTFFVHDS